MRYDLWDLDTANLHGNFSTEEEALALVRTLVDAFGEEFAEDLQLGGCDDAGQPITPLRGAALLKRAKAHDKVSMAP